MEEAPSAAQAGATGLSADEAMLIVDGRRHRVTAQVEGDAFVVSTEVTQELLGWTAEPLEGGRYKLCREEQCVMVGGATDDGVGHAMSGAGEGGSAEAIVRPGGIDLRALAQRLDNPFEMDAEARAASWVRSAGEQAARLTGERAPDVLLTDMDGNEQWLSALFGRKLMLLAYASW